MVNTLNKLQSKAETLSLKMVISDGPCHSHVSHMLGIGAVTTCFNDSGLLRPGIEPRSPTHAR